MTPFDADGEESAIVLAPGETRDVSFWAGPESPTWFAADARLLSPGTYRFQLVSHPKLDSAALANVNRAVDQAGVADAVVSNEATYTVETPDGEDAAVWELIRQLRSPTLWRDALGTQIWQAHPSSRYAAFSLRVKNPTDPEMGIAAHEAALAKHPSPAWAEWSRLAIAEYEVQRKLDFLSERDADGAFAATERAKAIVMELKDSGNPHVRKEAQRILKTDVRTRDQIVDSVRRLSGEIREVRPFVACIEAVEGGKHRFWFGYDNTASEPLSIPIGRDNRFTPPPSDRGQPTVFPTSGAKLGLQVVTDEPALTWHFQKYNVHASVAATQPCPADLRERFEYAPPQRN
ncbi:MAG TPA: hypothetical protein VFP80_07300 [Thermoanaerobaculia bacterium]|nr:hypothetical protein [Thermoanaerobaculia bacterium]